MDMHEAKGADGMTANRQQSDKKGGKSKKLSGTEQVVEYLSNLEHPLKKEIEEVRSIILHTDGQLEEGIKWNAPSFSYAGEDKVTFNLHGKDYFLLVFHCGSKVKETKVKTPLFDDATGLLEWLSGDRATITFTDMNDVKTKEAGLAAVVAKWIEATSTG